MSNVQLENGYIRIANELLEAIYKIRLSGLQKDVLFCVIRFTYGFQKKESELSVRFIAKKINSSAPRVTEALSKLIQLDIVKIVEEANQNHTGRILTVNKKYDEWKEFENGKQFANEKHISSKIGNAGSSKTGNNIKTVFKENLNTHESITHPLRKHIKINLERVSKLDKQLTNEECNSLLEKFDKQEIKSTLEEMENYKKLTTQYVSVYRTLNNWIKMKRKRNEKFIPVNGNQFNNTVSLTNQIGVD